MRGCLGECFRRRTGRRFLVLGDRLGEQRQGRDPETQDARQTPYAKGSVIEISTAKTQEKPPPDLVKSTESSGRGSNAVEGKLSPDWQPRLILSGYDCYALKHLKTSAIRSRQKCVLMPGLDSFRFSF